MGLFKKKNKEPVVEKRAFSNYPHLMALKPREKYVFHSDYMEIDGQYQTIMAFFHNDGANDKFSPFWGINRIPSGLGDDITVILLEQARRMTDGWIADHQTKAESISKTGSAEQSRGGTNSGRNKARASLNDLQVISEELQAGASYLNVHNRMIVKAPTLEKLDMAVDNISRMYVERFSTLSAAAYPAEQRGELTNLFKKNSVKKGSGFYYTSTEFAGSHALVTNGLSDPAGEYVGVMRGDVNNSAVLFDVNDYRHHVVIANENKKESLGDANLTDMWGSKLSQACMIENGRSIHLILNDCNLDDLGPGFRGITYTLDMNKGDVNMFEMFGDVKDELSIFPTHIEKVKLMAEQAYQAADVDKGAIRGSLEEILTQFYVDNRMWYYNAEANRDRLRIVGLNHKEVPTLYDFSAYLDVAYKSLSSKTARDNQKLRAISALNYTFKNMLTSNSDLFNTHTSDAIDGAKKGKRVIYDFSDLLQRGIGIAMAQLVNIIGFAIGTLKKGDSLIIHGAERIDNGVKKYLTQQLDLLYSKGGRVCFLYNNIDKMLKDKDFNNFDKADYTILGNMTETVISDYQKLLGQNVPADLKKIITSRAEDINYIRRNYVNVVFEMDLLLNIPKKTEKGGYRNGRSF